MSGRLAQCVIQVCVVGTLGVLLTAPVPSEAADAPELVEKDGRYAIDLPTTLRLVQARNLDVQLANERMAEARANYLGSVEKFLPWVTVGVNYRRHEGRTQAVDGTLLDVDKQSTTLGPTVTAQVDLGDAWFSTLAAKQLVTATGFASDAQQQDAKLAAATAYFELLKSRVLAEAMQDAVLSSEEYERQLDAGVHAGVVFKGDLLRVSTQTQRFRTAALGAHEQQRLASSRLAELLHLSPAVELVPQDADLVPIALADTGITIEALLESATRDRPEVKQSAAQLEAARAAEHSAVFGALLPTIGAQAFLGKLGGGRGDASGDYGASRDYYIGLSWRFGPGGLFDVGRIRAARSRLGMAEIAAGKSQALIERQIVDAWTRLDVTGKQMVAARAGLAAATETQKLTRDRKQLGVGVVLEDIQAQQEVVRARTDYVTAIAEFNKAQYELSRASGLP